MGREINVACVDVSLCLSLSLSLSHSHSLSLSLSLCLFLLFSVLSRGGGGALQGGTRAHWDLHWLLHDEALPHDR